MPNAILNEEFYPDLLDGLRELLAITPSKDRPFILIQACIGDGIDTRARMLPIAMQLGIERPRLMAVLRDHTGNNSARHLWKVDDEGRYSLHE